MSEIQTQTFKGARYVPLFPDPIQWSADRAYEAITAVQHNAFTYLSKRPVPVGVEITNTEFWLLWADPNAQMEQLRQEVGQYADNVDELNSIVDGMSDDLVGIKSDISTTTSNYANLNDVAADSDFQLVSNKLNGSYIYNDYIVSDTQTNNSVELPNGKFATIIKDQTSKGIERTVYTHDKFKVNIPSDHKCQGFTSDDVYGYIAHHESDSSPLFITKFNLLTGATVNTYQLDFGDYSGDVHANCLSISNNVMYITTYDNRIDYFNTVEFSHIGYYQTAYPIVAYCRRIIGNHEVHAFQDGTNKVGIYLKHTTNMEKPMYFASLKYNLAYFTRQAMNINDSFIAVPIFTAAEYNLSKIYVFTLNGILRAVYNIPRIMLGNEIEQCFINNTNSTMYVSFADGTIISFDVSPELVRDNNPYFTSAVPNYDETCVYYFLPNGTNCTLINNNKIASEIYVNANYYYSNYTNIIFVANNTKYNGVAVYNSGIHLYIPTKDGMFYALYNYTSDKEKLQLRTFLLDKFDGSRAVIHDDTVITDSQMTTFLTNNNVDFTLLPELISVNGYGNEVTNVIAWD